MSQSMDRRRFIQAGAVVAVAAAGAGALGQASERRAALGTKIIGISCSPRKGKTTAVAVTAALEAAREAGAQTELIELADLKLELAPPSGQDDDLAKVVRKLGDAQVGGIIIGSPVYMGTISTQCKLLLDRMMMLRRDNFALRDKVGGAIAVGGVRNGGQEMTLQAILMSLLCHDMVIVGDGRPTAHWGGTLLNDGKDDISGDAFGLTTARGVGRRVAEMAMRVAQVPPK
mgnify:CR=1 FL=1